MQKIGIPIFSVMSEIYSQYLEHNFIDDILTKCKMDDYFRYVGDILLV